MKNVKDSHTIAYFNDYVPEYPLSRFEPALKVINQYGNNESTFLDVGCGTGNVLDFIRDTTIVRDVYGMDVSSNCLAKTRERIGCQTFLGSILDDNFIEAVPQKFDFILLSAVLHHLIGKTRRECRILASRSIDNCLNLLNESGFLIIMEPIFCPVIVMDIIFYMKKLVTHLTSKRIHIFNKRSNIGAPVVSYYTDKQLFEMIGCTKNCKVVDVTTHDITLAPLWRLAMINRRANTTIVVKKQRTVMSQ